MITGATTTAEPLLRSRRLEIAIGWQPRVFVADNLAMHKTWLAAGVLTAALLAVSVVRFVGEPALSRVPAEANAAPGQGAATVLLFDGKVQLNRATREDLIALPGIGPKRAQRILDLRGERGGTFSSVDDLLNVSGIGPRILEKLRPHVTAR